MRKGGEARHSFSERVLGAFSLREAMFSEIVADANANQHAIRALVVGSLGPAIGGWLAYRDPWAFGYWFVIALATWAAYGAITYLLATRLFNEASTQRKRSGYARAVAFAGLPRFVLVLALNPTLYYILGAIALVWGIVATVLALRVALKLTLTRAIGAAVLGTVVLAVLTSLVVNIALGLT